MPTNQDCVNARLIRYEYGSVAELPSYVSFPSTYYLSVVFLKGGREFKSVFPVQEKIVESSFLGYIGKVVERVEETDSILIYHFTDGTNIWFGN